MTLYAARATILKDGGVALAIVTATPAAPSSGAVLYVEAGALKVKGSSGTVTVLGPA